MANRWLRGPATATADWVELDATQAEEYSPTSQRGLFWDLQGIHVPADVPRFVERWGLLHSGHPDEQPEREPWSEWDATARRFRLILSLHARVQQALAGGDEAAEALRQLEALAGTMTSALGASREPANDLELVQQASGFVARAVDLGLADVRTGLAAAFEWTVGANDGPGEPGAYVLTAHPADLVGHAYHEMALHLANRIPTRVCAECGTVFPVGHRRQKYCTEDCGARARYRRWQERQKEQR